MAGGDAFLQANIGLLWSYVADRVLKRASPDAIREALATQQGLIETFDAHIAEAGEQNRRTLDLLEDRIARTDFVNDENKRLYERLIAERDRSAYLEGHADALARITPDQDAKLVSMSTPLLKDMGRALQKSASTLQVIANDNEANPRHIIFLNRRMAREVDLEQMDDQTTLILVHIVQYNVETGWGKLRTAEHQGLLSFNVPSDLKGRLQAAILREMNRQDSYIECQFVRTPQRVLQRAIVRAIRNIEDLEGPR